MRVHKGSLASDRTVDVIGLKTTKIGFDRTRLSELRKRGDAEVLG